METQNRKTHRKVPGIPSKAQGYENCFWKQHTYGLNVEMVQQV
jgi:hypothetical protein